MQKKIRGHGMELGVGFSDRSWCLVGSMDSSEKDGSSAQSHMSGVQRSCDICNTTKTPLWRGGPAGSKSLCNACGIKYRKKSRDPPGYVIKREKKLRENRRNRSGVLLKLELAASSRSDVLFQGLLLHKQRKLAEEEEAAVLLTALSWGLVN